MIARSDSSHYNTHPRCHSVNAPEICCKCADLREQLKEGDKDAVVTFTI